MSINKVILIGNLCQDPKVKNFEGGKVASASLATSEKGYKKKDGKEVPEQTEFHNLSVFGKLADVVEKYCHKGDKLYIEGRLHTRSWEKDGEKRYATEIIVTDIQMLGGKPATENSSANANKRPDYEGYGEPIPENDQDLQF